MQINFNIATSWNGLSNWQLKNIAGILFTSYKERKKSFLLTFYLFASSNKLWNWLKLLILLLRVPYSQLNTHTSFLYKTADLTRFSKRVRSGFRYLYGPADRLANLSIDEYAHADLFYYNWTKAKKEQDLNRLVTVLYRPRAKSNSSVDKRKPFNSRELKFHAKTVERLPLKTKIPIMMAFQGSRQAIVKRYTNVFKKSRAKEVYTPFTKIIASMAGGEFQPFGDFYKTKEAGLYDFLDVLNDQIEYQNELNKKYKS